MSASVVSKRWGGGISPFDVTWQKMMMWWFIVNDGVLFGGFLASYGFNRLASDTWPDQSRLFSTNFIALMTFVLISSSATMATAVGAAQRGDSKLAVRMLLATIVGGSIFLGMQAFEWTGFISEGARLTGWAENSEFVAEAAGFPAFFFMITGLHGTHVLIGVIILIIAAVRASGGRYSAGGIAVPVDPPGWKGDVAVRPVRVILTAVILLSVTASAAHAQSCCMPRFGEDDQQAARLINGIWMGTGILLVTPAALIAIGVAWYMLRCRTVVDANVTNNRESDGGPNRIPESGGPPAGGHHVLGRRLVRLR